MHRNERQDIARNIADAYEGVMRRRELLERGVSYDDIRTELRAGRWRLLGRNTLTATAAALTPRARLWWAIWESGSRAILDGVSALHAMGLEHYDSDTVHVTVGRGHRAHDVPGVTRHRRREIGPLHSIGIPRAHRELATIRAAQWAHSEQQAALLICLPVQQRLVHPDRLLQTWREVRRSPRRACLEDVITAVCDGAHAISELRFDQLCRRAGLPQPTRQVRRVGPGGTSYLDCYFDEHRLVVEIDGAHHGQGLNPLADHFRANELTIGADRVLRIPLLGLRLDPNRWLGQVARALDQPLAA